MLQQQKNHNSNRPTPQINHLQHKEQHLRHIQPYPKHHESPTLPETNMFDPENGCLEHDPAKMPIVSGAISLLVFREGIYLVGEGHQFRVPVSDISI